MNPYNPEEETFRLAHGQRDRFAIATAIGYPSERGEVDLLDRFAGYDALADIDPIVAPGDVVKVQRGVALVHVPDVVREYLVQLVRATRDWDGVSVGASPRAALSLQRCCQALALISDCTEVQPDHVEELFVPCLAHRMQFHPGVEALPTAQAILESVPAPAWKKPTLVSAEDDLLDAHVPEPLSADLPGVSRLQRRLESA
jgi:MoxR-like ATPase